MVRDGGSNSSKRRCWAANGPPSILRTSSESWCANETKSRAATIDLCNNPLTKEPKLDQAKRIGGARWAAIDGSLEKELQHEATSASPAETHTADLKTEL